MSGRGELSDQGLDLVFRQARIRYSRRPEPVPENLLHGSISYPPAPIPAPPVSSSSPRTKTAKKLNPALGPAQQYSTRRLLMMAAQALSLDGAMVDAPHPAQTRSAPQRASQLEGVG